MTKKDNIRAHTPTTKDDSSGSKTPEMTRKASLTPTNYLKIATKRLENYNIGRELGKGAYATVRLAINKRSNEQIAIKSYHSNQPRAVTGIKQEIYILHKLQHPNLIRMVEVIQTPTSLHLVTEYIHGCPLSALLKRQTVRRFDEDLSRSIFRQIVSAVDYCHFKDIAHRDIKLENIMIDANYSIKLIDFGFATIVQDGRKSRTFCGTPSYMAPELVRKEEYCPFQVDVWALGILLYVMLSGKFPFTGKAREELYSNISNCPLTLPEDISKSSRKLISKMLNKIPSQRPSVRDIFHSKWLSEEGNL